MLETKYKQSADQLDYDVDFSAWLPEGDTITTAVASVIIEDELIIQSVQVSDLVVKVWLSGGINGSTYKVTVAASTEGGRIKETEFNLRVKDV